MFSFWGFWACFWGSYLPLNITTAQCHQNSLAAAFCSAVGEERTFTSQRPPFQGSFAILSSLNAAVVIFSPVSEKTVLCPESSLLSHFTGTWVVPPDGILVAFL